ncbi:hypothetical protein V493_01458 [Pseudogymnoascus sp. VKM F-4281 (FW-2241)]|nr:hypothetical protein V493_01458 [Pseudogymnoascus sp. VKM F-4281 (FW-2241)]
MPAPPEPQATTGGYLTKHQQSQSTFAVISSRRCKQPNYSVKNTFFSMSTLKRMKARMQTLATSSRPSQPKNSCGFPEATTLSHRNPHPEGDPETILKRRIQDRLKAIGACLPESVADTKDPIPDIPVPAETETPNDTPTAPFDVQITFLGRTATRYAVARAFNLGVPAPDREELVGLCDKIARRDKEPEIMWSLEGTYVPRGVPKGRVARFVETGLLEADMGMGMEIGVETGLEVQSERDSLVADNAALAVDMSTKSVRSRVRELWAKRQRRELGSNC